MSLKHVVVVILLFAGVGLEAVCCLGLLAMRDVYDRLHYAAPGAFGAALIATAVLVQESFSLIGNKALATGAVLLLTGPVLAHVTARTARIRDHGDWRPQRDERIEVGET
jgi:monovalent cation/proton antiporter MnhG/PhaG subunit